MSAPPPLRATYRLQFREGFGFADAVEIVPHLAASGISHVYASPIFCATSGSTHGYDVTDHGAIDPVLGGMDGFLRLSAALKAHGLGLVLDIVPNHMAASAENPWWRDVLQRGEASAFAGHFDIDWSADKLIVPILGKPYGEALEDGDIARAEHPEWGPVLRVPGNDLPLAPGTEAIDDVHACHEAQPYRLAHWRIGRDGLTYRRFFEITGLVGVRVEDEAVFDDVHRLVRELVDGAHVHALRVDHVDGLADPAGYLARLATFGVPVVVEKILEAGEALPPWPVEGTTGYEFVAAMAAHFVDAQGLAVLAQAYGAIAQDDVAAMERRAKTQVAEVNLAGEFARLTREALALFSSDLSARDHGPDTVRRGLVALSRALDVYRTYIEGEASAADRARLESAVHEAHDDALDERRVIGDLGALIASGRADAVPFVRRWQQTTGPLMAKAVEDTLFYRHHRLLALNEVGGHPSAPLGEDAADAAMTVRGLATTQTHDTKRGEDSRARLSVLSDPVAAAWWCEFARTLPGDAPPAWRWAIGQMWLGALPLAPDPDFADRLLAAVEKSAREAKEETSWTDVDAAFETRLRTTAEAILAGEETGTLAEIVRAGALASLAQAALKTFAAAVPDIYQGGFGWDFSLVDPDNRRPVDFAAEAALCEAARAARGADLLDDWRDGRVKARVLLEGLALRAAAPSLFRPDASWKRLAARSPAVAAYWREAGGRAALCVVPRRPLGLLAPAGARLDPARMGPITLDVPAAVTSSFTGRTLREGTVDVSAELAEFPVVLAASG